MSAINHQSGNTADQIMFQSNPRFSTWHPTHNQYHSYQHLAGLPLYPLFDSIITSTPEDNQAASLWKSSKAGHSLDFSCFSEGASRVWNCNKDKYVTQNAVLHRDDVFNHSFVSDVSDASDIGYDELSPACSPRSSTSDNQSSDSDSDDSHISTDSSHQTSTPTSFNDSCSSVQRLLSSSLHRYHITRLPRSTTFYDVTEDDLFNLEVSSSPSARLNDDFMSSVDKLLIHVTAIEHRCLSLVVDGRLNSGHRREWAFTFRLKLDCVSDNAISFIQHLYYQHHLHVSDETIASYIKQLNIVVGRENLRLSRY